MPAPHHSAFTDRVPFLPPNQQSTEGKFFSTKLLKYYKAIFMKHIVNSKHTFLADPRKEVLFGGHETNI